MKKKRLLNWSTIRNMLMELEVLQNISLFVLQKIQNMWLEWKGLEIGNDKILGAFDIIDKLFNNDIVHGDK